MISDESSEFDQVFQNKVIKLRIYYANIFLAKLDMTLLVELDLSAVVNIAKLEIVDVKSLASEQSILLHLSPARDASGNIIKSAKIFEDLKADMLQKIGVRLDDMSKKNKILKIDLIQLISPRSGSSEEGGLVGLLDLQKFDLLHSISQIQAPVDQKLTTASELGELLENFKSRTDLKIHTVLDKLLLHSNSPTLFLGYLKIKKKFTGNSYSPKSEKAQMFEWNFKSDVVNDGHLDEKKLYDVSFVFRGLRESCKSITQSNSIEPLTIINKWELVDQKHLAVVTKCQINSTSSQLAVTVLDMESDINLMRFSKVFLFTHKLDDDLRDLIEVDLIPRKIDSHIDYLNPQQDVSGYSYFNFFNYMPRTYDYIRDESVLSQSRSNFVQTKNHWILAITIHKEIPQQAN